MTTLLLRFRVLFLVAVCAGSIFSVSSVANAAEWGYVNCTTMSSEDVSNDPSACASCRLACLKGLILPTIGACQANVTLKCATAAAKVAAEEVKEATCTEGPRECCIEDITDENAEAGTGAVQKEDCKNKDGKGGVVYYADCFCANKEGGSKLAKSGQSPAACKELCSKEELTMDESRGIGAFSRLKAAEAGPSASALQFVNALCFSNEECSDAEGTWEASTECTNSKGKCLAPEPVLTLSSPILGETSVTGLRGYVTLAFRFLLAISVLTATIAFMYGGIKYIIGSTTGDISSAKKYMVDAVIGLLLLFGAVTLLNTLNPETTRYDKLTIYLINKEEFSRNDFCKDFIGKDKKPPKYADSAAAGDPPGSITFDNAKFEPGKKLEETLCGNEYYVKGFGGKLCKGLACPSGSEVCLPCKAGIKECFGITAGRQCVPVAVAADIKFTDGVKPIEMHLVAICNHVQPGDKALTLDHMEDNVPDSVTLDMSDAGTDSVAFLKEIEASVATDLAKECEKLGGLRGVVLGVVYRDTSGIVGTIAGATNAPVSPNVSDVLIMGKKDCTENPSFSGYANGGGIKIAAPPVLGILGSIVDLSVNVEVGGVGVGLSDFQAAVYCGYQKDFNPYFGNSGLYWTPDELSQAFSGSGKAIECHSRLNKTNAPGDPQTKFYPDCKP